MPFAKRYVISIKEYDHLKKRRVHTRIGWDFKEESSIFAERGLITRGLITGNHGAYNWGAYNQGAYNQGAYNQKGFSVTRLMGLISRGANK